MIIKSTPAGRQDRHLSLSRLERRRQADRRKCNPKPRKCDYLGEIKTLAAACIAAGDEGTSRLTAYRLTKFDYSGALDRLMDAAAERGFMFWEDNIPDTDRRTSIGRGISEGRIGILSWPAGLTSEGDHVAD
jgi:hypothetical protein